MFKAVASTWEPRCPLTSQYIVTSFPSRYGRRFKGFHVKIRHQPQIGAPADSSTEVMLAQNFASPVSEKNIDLIRLQNWCHANLLVTLPYLPTPRYLEASSSSKLGFSLLLTASRAV
jgi:hypothetical protein